MAANGPYQAYYCEENVLRLIASWPADARAHSEVWLITNAARRALILNQRRGDPDHLGAIVWDYHVVAVREGQVFDYDSRGVWGQDVQSYIVQTLAPAMALEDPAFVPEVRVFAAQDYVDVFSSDRRHMRDKHGGFLHAPPPWAARMPRGHQLDALLDLSDVSLGGRVYDVAGLVARFGNEQPAHGESAPNNPIPDQPAERIMTHPLLTKPNIIPPDAERAYVGPKITLHRFDVTLPGGTVWPMELIDHPGASAIVAVDDQLRVILIRQYRHATGGYIWEIPAGTLEPDESPLLCAHRELAEESGLLTEHMVPLGSIYTVPSFCNEIIHLFLATGLTATKAQPEPDEVIDEVRRVPLETALEMIDAGEIVDAKSISGLFRAERKLRREGRLNA